VKVQCPTIKLNKTQIVKRLIDLDFPLKYLWSCYNNGEKMCSLCESCQRLRRALLHNNLTTSLNELFTATV